MLAGITQLGDEPTEVQGGTELCDAYPQINAHTTFFYYRDLVAAEWFYGNILGLNKTLDRQWVKMFRITGQSYVGLVDEQHGIYRAPDSTPSVILSIETNDLEGWNARLNALGVTLVKGLDINSEQSLVDSILLKDPADYTIEFYRWK